MLRKSLILFSTACMLACSPAEKKQEMPDNCLNKEQMIEVLTDFTLMEASINAKYGQPNQRVNDTSFRFNIFKEHGISRAQYDSSLHYYSKDPVLFKEIYDSVLVRITDLKNGKQ